MEFIRKYLLWAVYFFILLFAIGHYAVKERKITTWDSFGYYMYLPSVFIYQDISHLKWVDSIEAKYHLIGNTFYQVRQVENGHYVNKYFYGTAWVQLPFFFIGHWIAGLTDYPQDGFSLPYQYALAFGILFYGLFFLGLLRKMLCRYFPKWHVDIAIVLLLTGSNLFQYLLIEPGQCHAAIFPIYVLILYFTDRWHRKPKIIWSFLLGVFMGWAVACRPTEIICIFIPLLWGLENKLSAKEKWVKVRENRSHILWALLGAGLLIFPQLLYWKMTSGEWIFNLGSKWLFFNPFFRTLFGFTNGWFVYTPVAILFIVGMFFIRRYDFSRSVWFFCFLNIWIVISWFDWHYGGTYSMRALVQSYPVFLFPLTAVVNRAMQAKGRILFVALFLILGGLNLFQIGQYNKNIIHYRDMNFKYYKHIFLRSGPSPVVFSLLDTEDWVENEEEAAEHKVMYSLKMKNIDMHQEKVFYDTLCPELKHGVTYYKVTCELKCERGFWDSYFFIESGDKSRKFRICRPLAKEGHWNAYVFYFKKGIPGQSIRVGVRGTELAGQIRGLRIERLGFQNGL